MKVPNYIKPKHIKRGPKMQDWPKRNGNAIAIVQTGSWGDNINSTLMFGPIRDKYPNHALDVYTSSYYGSAFHNNKYITELIELPAHTKEQALHLTLTTKPVLVGYDLVLAPHPMFNGDKWTSMTRPELNGSAGSNLICAWIRALEENNIPFGELQTHLSLTNKEIENVDKFCDKINMLDHKLNIMEIHGESGQTFFNDTWTKTIVEKLCSRNEIVFISHRIGCLDLAAQFPNLCYNVNHLTIRECAELFNRCDKFFSVSSGLSNACNSDWCKKDIEWVEIINSASVSSAPIRSTGKTFWYDNNLLNFLETV